MIRFREFQMSWIVIIASGLVLVLITLLFAFQLGTRPISPLNYLLVFGILSLTVSLMYGMTTAVTEKEVSISFGFGLIRKRFDVGTIQDVREVTNPWFYGLGIRIIPNGWLYNMGGTKAVELSLKSGRVARIGTRKSAELGKAIRETLARRS